MFINNPTFISVCLVISALRIYLEIVGFNFQKLPMTSKLPPDQQIKVHRTGFYICVGYVILFAPEVLLS